MQNIVKLVLSRDGVFQFSFADGQAALVMTTNGYDALDILLSATHAKLKDKQSCE